MLMIEDVIMGVCCTKDSWQNSSDMCPNAPSDPTCHKICIAFQWSRLQDNLSRRTLRFCSCICNK